MYKDILRTMVACMAVLTIYTLVTTPKTVIEQVRPVVEKPIVVYISVIQEKDEATDTDEPEESISELPLTEEEIGLLALVTMAEAEGEPEEGQRLVIDTILNRMDSSSFPDNLHDVIYQPSQFSSMWNGRVDRCYVKEEIVELIEEELVSRTNSDVIYFRTGRYSDYGVPLFKVGNHYFSSQK